MSDPNSSPLKAPKAMSSRLMTMKFMQRAAASSPAYSPTTPEQSPSKRQKTENSSPASFDIDSLVDISAIRSALAAEEANRQTLLDKQAAAAGDTRWVLNFERDTSSSNDQQKKPLRVIPAGFAAIDRISTTKAISDEDVEDRPILIGRRSFGKFNRLLEKLQDPTSDETSESDSDQEDDSAEESGASEDDPTNILAKEAKEEETKKLKAERKARRKAEKAESLRLAAARKKKDINLNKLTSISGGSSASKQPCYRCGEVGHLKADCPKQRTHKHSDGDRPQNREG